MPKMKKTSLGLNLFKIRKSVLLMKIFGLALFVFLAMAIAATAQADSSQSPAALNYTPAENTFWDMDSVLEFSACWNKPIDKAEFWTNNSGALQKNISARISGNCSYATYRTPNTTASIQWFLNASDAFDLTGKTDTALLFVKDLPPQFSEISQNATEVKAGGGIMVSARIKDKTGLSSVILSVNDTGEFKNVSQKKISGLEYVVNFVYSLSANLEPQNTVAWKLFSNDTKNNFNTTDIGYFSISACPETCEGQLPGSCTEYSDCSSGNQNRVCFACDKSTGYSCERKIETKSCEITEGKEDAQNEITSAEEQINSVKSGDPPRNTSTAEEFLSEAKKAFSAGNYQKALERATAAKNAAFSASIITTKEEGSGQTGLIVAAVVLILFIGVAILFREKILDSLQRFKQPAKEEKKKVEAPPVCEICGNISEKLFECEECGKKVCFDHARSFKGHSFCSDCLKKRGLM